MVLLRAIAPGYVSEGRSAVAPGPTPGVALAIRATNGQYAQVPLGTWDTVSSGLRDVDIG